RVYFLLLCLILFAAPARAQTLGLWFDDLVGGPLVMTVSDTISLMGAIMRTVQGSPTAPPDALRADTSPRIVFLSMSDGQSPARVVIGTGRGILEAVDDAVAKARTFVLAESPPTWFKP